MTSSCLHDMVSQSSHTVTIHTIMELYPLSTRHWHTWYYNGPWLIPHCNVSVPLKDTWRSSCPGQAIMDAIESLMLSIIPSVHIAEVNSLDSQRLLIMNWSLWEDNVTDSRLRKYGNYCPNEVDEYMKSHQKDMGIKRSSCWRQKKQGRVRSLAPEICASTSNFISVFLNSFSILISWELLCEIVFKPMPPTNDPNDDKSTLVQLMAWSCQTASHYLSQYWPRFMLPYDNIGPQLGLRKWWSDMLTIA